MKDATTVHASQFVDEMMTAATAKCVKDLFVQLDVDLTLVALKIIRV